MCQNQSIDDSDADLARDLRRIVREQLVAGKSDGEIIAYVTARYGDFVLLKPPVEPATWGLWFGPALVLVIAAAGLVVYVGLAAGRGRPTAANLTRRAPPARCAAARGVWTVTLRLSVGFLS